MHPILRFWITTLALLAGVGALVFLSLSFVFPDAGLFADLGAIERFAAVGVVVVALGIVVWNTVTRGDVVAVEAPRRGQ